MGRESVVEWIVVEQGQKEWVQAESAPRNWTQQEATRLAARRRSPSEARHPLGVP